MNAKKGKRIIEGERTRLETVIPLDTPFILFLDPSSKCNLSCQFCPCGNAHKDSWGANKKTSIMPYSLYRKIIDDVAQFPVQLKVLRLYKEGEPLLNKRLPDMIHYAKKKEVAGSIDFTTNGVLLVPDLSLALIDAGIDRINISVEALSEEEYFKVCGLKIDFRQFINNLQFLYKNKQQCHIFIKIIDESLGKHKEQEFFDLFGEFCDEIDIEKVTPVWPEFQLESQFGNKFETNILGGEVNNNLVCPYIFYQMCINSDGSVSACLMDWNHKLIVGNAKDRNVVEIWQNEVLTKMRIENLSANRNSLDVCKECGQLKYGGLVDNIDEYREELLSKILMKE